MINDYASYAEMQAQSLQRIEAVKPRLILALKDIGAERVTVEYDGEGDSGQIESITATGIDGEAVDLKRPHRISYGEAQPSCETLEALIEAFVWDVLGLFHDGFENDDGGYGRLTISVGRSIFLLEHRERFVDVLTSAMEV